MADIFVSYSNKDRARVRVLAEALSAFGWSVWWDCEIPAGRTFDEVIAEALAAASCVVVVWSKESVRSNWVLDEAEEGRRRGILVPVLIDESHPPLGFGRIQAVDLGDWNGDATAERFQRLRGDIASRAGAPRPVDADAGPPTSGGATSAVTPRTVKGDVLGDVFAAATRSRKVRWPLAAALAVALVAFGLYRFATDRSDAPETKGSTAPATTTSQLLLNAVLKEGVEPLDKGVSYAVYEAAKDAEGKRKRVASSNESEDPPRIPLSAGRYFVTASYGSATASTEIDLKKGEVKPQVLNLRAGILPLSTVLAPGGEPLKTSVSYDVYSAARDIEGKRKRIVGSNAYEGPPRFPLPAGRYYVTASYGSATAAIEIEIAAGEIKPQTLSLGAGILPLSTVLGTGSEPLKTGVNYDVYTAATDIEGNRKRIVGSNAYEGPPRFPLPAGRYHVVAGHGSAVASAEIDIIAGQITPTTLDLHAGILAITSVLASGGPPLAKGVNYDVYGATKDIEGNRKRVTGSNPYEGPPRFPLPAGRYYVSATSGVAKGEAEVSVTEGKVQPLQLRLSRTNQR